MKTLNIAKNLKLPEDTVTSTLIVYGGKGMGKTNLLSVACEEMAGRRQKFSVIDPMGVCWGLQHGADRSGRGIDVLIMGGIHGDIPIEPTAGAVVADLVVDETVSTVIDISRHANGKMWSKGERIRFVADYCTRLYERQGETRLPLMQYIDEAARFIPQHIPHGAVDIARCVGAIEQLVEEGRNIGVGIWLFTQRSARINKSVAELADCMFSFRTVGPNSIKAILEWLGEHVDKSRWNDLLAKIRTLPIGQALVVSPGWLQYEGIAEVRSRETFDSSATPKHGKSLRAPGKATKPDLKKYRERMAATIEKAQADDPRVLKARIAKLEGILAEANTRAERIDKKLDRVQSAAPVKTVEVPVFGKADMRDVRAALAKMTKLSDKMHALDKDWDEHVIAIIGNLKKLTSIVELATPPFSSKDIAEMLQKQQKQANLVMRKVISPESELKSLPGNDLSAYAHGLLQTMARRHPMQVTRGQLAVLAGRSLRSSAYSGAMTEILRSGMVRQSDNLFSLTDAGVMAYRAGGSDATPDTPQERQETWRRALPAYERALFDVLLAVYPESISREDLADRSGKSINSSKFAGSITSLRKNGLADDLDNRQVKASEILF